MLDLKEHALTQKAEEELVEQRALVLERKSHKFIFHSHVHYEIQSITYQITRQDRFSEYILND